MTKKKNSNNKSINNQIIVIGLTILVIIYLWFYMRATKTAFLPKELKEDSNGELHLSGILSTK